MKLLNALVVTSLLGLSFHAHARAMGGESSGGGTGIVCRDLKGKITEAVSLDLYESMARGTPMKKASGDVEADYAKLFAELRKSAADERPVGPGDIDFLNQTLAKFIFVKQSLPPTHDTGTLPENLPAGCSVEQVIIAHDSRDRFSVNEEIWNALDSLDKASFVVHEFLYQIARWTANEKTSERIRAVVGAAASAKGLENSYQGATQGQSIVCTASVLGLQSLNSEIVIYDSPENSQESIVLLTKYFGFLPMFRMAHKVPKIDPAKLVYEKVSDAIGTVLVVKDPQAKFNDGMYVGQKNLSGEFYSLTYSNNLPFMISKLAPNTSTRQYEPVTTGFFKTCRIWKWVY